LLLPLSFNWLYRAAHAWRLSVMIVRTVRELIRDVGLVGMFLYGSTLFKTPQLCRDVDIVLVTCGRQRLWHLSLPSLHPGIPKLSITLADVPTVEADLHRLASAGYLLNKFINPLLPVAGTQHVLAWQERATAAVSVISGATPEFVVRWKDERFSDRWRRTHHLALPPWPVALRTGTRRLDDLALSAAERGHWDVYKSLK
jgi:hypothetical protein